MNAADLDGLEIPDFLKRSGPVKRVRVPERKAPEITLKLEGKRSANEHRRRTDLAIQVARAQINKHGETTFGRVQKRLPDLEPTYIKRAKARLKKIGAIRVEGKLWIKGR